jgi:hypothetical protein
MSTIEQLEADLITLRKQLRCERDQEQRVLLQLDMAQVAQQLADVKAKETASVH